MVRLPFQATCQILIVFIGPAMPVILHLTVWHDNVRVCSIAYVYIYIYTANRHSETYQQAEPPNAL